jgi:hypothetical protein
MKSKHDLFSDRRMIFDNIENTQWGECRVYINQYFETSIESQRKSKDD